jgi:integrase
MRAPGNHTTNDPHAPRPARHATLGPLPQTLPQGAVSRPTPSVPSPKPGPSPRPEPPRLETMPPSRQPKLLDRLREALRARHYSPRTDPNAPTEWEWQFRFPQEKRWVNPRTGEQGRPHVDPAILQRVVKAAAVAIGITKHATCHTLRHSGVYPALCGTTHPAMGEDGYDIRTIQELLGHTDVKTTMIYTHVLNRGGKGVRSPVDAL